MRDFNFFYVFIQFSLDLAKRVHWVHSEMKMKSQHTCSHFMRVRLISVWRIHINKLQREKRTNEWMTNSTPRAHTHKTIINIFAVYTIQMNCTHFNSAYHNFVISISLFSLDFERLVSVLPFMMTRIQYNSCCFCSFLALQRNSFNF